MRSLAGTVCILIGSALTLGVQHSDDWIKYDSKEGRYSVMLPVQPTVGSQEAVTSDGIKFTQYKAGVFREDAAYLIGYFDYTGEMTFTFDKARDGMVAGVNGTLIRERSIKLDTYLGRELRINAKDETGLEFDMRARIFDIGRRIYVLQFIAPKSADVGVADVKAAKYFDSFQVVRSTQN
jgi:hypothetical protein